MIINQGLQSRTVKLATSNKKMLDCMTYPPLEGRGVTALYRIYLGICSPKGYGFSAGLVTNNILVDLGLLGHNRVWFLHSSFDMGMCLRSHHYQKDTTTLFIHGISISSLSYLSIVIYLST